jgi:GNAT superfamily N-acetyltransferase
MISIDPAVIEDARAIVELQRLCYQSEAAIYGDYHIPPLTQTAEDIRSEFETHRFLKAVDDGVIVGSVRAHLTGETCLIGRLFVHPDFQNRGIGARLMGEIESCFPHAGRFELFTGDRSEKNLHLYRKLGYQEFRSEPVTSTLTLVYMEKIQKRD